MCLGLQVTKYHGLGNDYLVVEEGDLKEQNLSNLAKKLCLPHYGLGADGLLINSSTTDGFRLRIFNPDGSEAEKSGNGLRIFARYLFDKKLVNEANSFSVTCKGGGVSCFVLDKGKMVRVAMGKVTFANKEQQAKLSTLLVDGVELRCVEANVGNPHCVVLVDRSLGASELTRLGGSIEVLPRFPNRTNVQFMQVLDRKNITIQIWERGAGITHASGSSSTAAAAVARSLDLCDDKICVQMLGGELTISFDSFSVASMQGAVTKVFCGEISEEGLAWVVPSVIL